MRLAEAAWKRGGWGKGTGREKSWSFEPMDGADISGFYPCGAG